MRTFLAVLSTALTLPALSIAQGTKQDYERAASLSQRTEGLVYRDNVKPAWLPGGTAFWYENRLPQEKREFILVDAKSGTRSPAFDHTAVSLMLAALRSDAQGAAERLEITVEDIDLQTRAIEFGFSGATYRFQPSSTGGTLIPVEKAKGAEEGLPRLRGSHPSQVGGRETTIQFVNRTDKEAQCLWIDPDGEERPYGVIAPGESHAQHTFAGHIWVAKATGTGQDLGIFEARANGGTAILDANAELPPRPRRDRSRRRPASVESNDWTATIHEHNVLLRHRHTDEEVKLSTDGTADFPYEPPLHWSPDGTKLIAYRTKRVEPRKIHMVESSPKDQLQPKLHTIDYPKPGDEIPQPKPQLLDIAQRRAIPIAETLFSNPWSISQGQWSEDGSEYRFLYNERGHQTLRMLALDPRSGSVRMIVEETSQTFIDYSQKSFHHWANRTGELIWMSERDGWNHLWLYDTASGKVKNQITQGNWLVHRVDHVDEERRQIWFAISGYRLGEDPYYLHLARVNFDGSGLTILTEGAGTHTWEWSPDRRYFVDRWSRVDKPPITELRQEEDGKLVCTLEQADAAALLATGWKPPQPFSAKGRDGQTDIYGVIIRPSNFDAKRKYPVIENIYAGPHGAFVQKEWARDMRSQTLAELGFIVVQIDGMGTNWREKKFHDVAWRNIADGGFPDRIAWIRAAAEKHPEMDVSRVGIFGGSAGGQNAMAALLHHGDFYQAAVADCGCHDNRMDKTWWNEAWLGYPVGSHYGENSNVTHAHKLQGKLLLTVGELDRNVDPASTMQVVNALIKADKDFELLVVPGGGHGVGETPYASRRRMDFFVRHLLGVEPRSENSRSTSSRATPGPKDVAPVQSALSSSNAS